MAFKIGQGSGGGGGAVASVNGKTGAVTLAPSDIGAATAASVSAITLASLGGVTSAQAAAAAPVQSVNGATGAVTGLATAASVTALAPTRTAFGDASATVTAGTRPTVALATAFTAARTLTLPAASSQPVGQPLYLVDEVGAISSANTLTLAAAGSDTLNGAASVTYATGRPVLELFSDGTSKWSIGVRPIAGGGTGATTAAGARTALGLATVAATGAYADLTGKPATVATPLLAYRAGDRLAGSRFTAMGARTQMIDQNALDPYAYVPRWYTVNGAKTFLCFLGDSITAALGIKESFAAIVYRQAAATYPAHFANMGVASARLLYAADATLDINQVRQTYAAPTFTKLAGVFVVFGGTNDISLDGQTGATAFARLVALCTSLRATHPRAKIVVVTPLPRQNAAGFETNRQSMQSSIIAGNAAYDYVADWGGDATMAANAAASTNTTYYLDQIHPTDAGNAIGVTYIQPQVNAALASLSL